MFVPVPVVLTCCSVSPIRLRCRETGQVTIPLLPMGTTVTLDVLEGYGNSFPNPRTVIFPAPLRRSRLPTVPF